MVLFHYLNDKILYSILHDIDLVLFKKKNLFNFAILVVLNLRYNHAFDYNIFWYITHKYIEYYLL